MTKQAWVIVGGAGILGAAYVAWKYMQFKNGGLTSAPTSSPAQYSATQPGLVYPYRPTVDPRVDNANQPWYGGSQAIFGQPTQLQTVKDTAGYLSAGSSIIHSISDIWGDLSTDTLASNDDYDLGNSDFDQSSGSYQDAGMGFGDNYSNLA